MLQEVTKTGILPLQTLQKPIAYPYRTHTPRWLAECAEFSPLAKCTGAVQCAACVRALLPKLAE